MKVFEIAKQTLLSLVFAVIYLFRLRSSGGWADSCSLSFVSPLPFHPFSLFPFLSISRADSQNITCSRNTTRSDNLPGLQDQARHDDSISAASSHDNVSFRNTLHPFTTQPCPRSVKRRHGWHRKARTPSRTRSTEPSESTVQTSRRPGFGRGVCSHQTRIAREADSTCLRSRVTCIR